MLHIGPGLRLPPEAVTETFAIVAKRGVGKTYTAAVMVEEMVKAALPVVVVDPIGVWWGLRSSADGKGPGLAVTILGGEHGDLPLEEGAGAVVADFLVDRPAPLVVDVSGFRKGPARRFMTDFLEQLYARNRSPLHVVLDEADEWAPQRPLKGAERLLGACEDLVRRGRARGLGCTLITQRPAVLHKDVLTQAEVLVALRIIGPQDRNAIDEWIKVHGTPEERAQLLASLAKLPVGSSWWWSPGWLDVFAQVKVRRRETFDSSATPTIGPRPAEPRNLAAVELDELKEQMAATIERAQADDPKELKRRIQDLERQLATARASAGRPQVVEVPVEVPVLPGDVAAELVSSIAELVDRLGDQAVLVDQLQVTRSLLEAWDERPAPPPRPPPRKQAPSPAPATAAPPPGPEDPADTALTPSDRKVLAALAQYPEGRSRRQVALLTGYKESGGRFGNLLSSLRTRGLLLGGRDLLSITDAGRAALGSWDRLPAGAELGVYWREKLPPSEGRVLQVLLEAWPDVLAKADLAAAAGYEPSGGRFGNICSRLRTLGLIEGTIELRAVDELCS